MTMKRIIALKSNSPKLPKRLESGRAWPIPDRLETKTEENFPANKRPKN
jgi:hypothetical protein